MAGLVLKNIDKIYPNGYQAVKNLNLEIKDKEFIVLVGPSGCGKSTSLRMIAGLEDITTGEIFIDNKLVNDVPPKDRDIAMVFQNYALYPHMTVYENMAFGLKLRKVSKEEIEKKVKEAAKILGIEGLLSRKPKELSGGQRQRVALGRAIVREPKVFLMDEPLSNLDAKLRVQMRSELSKLHQRLQTTFVYVTHDQTEAMTMGTRIVVMKDGVVQQIADPHTIYTKPANIFVASFIGSPQMNFIECKPYKEYDEVFLCFGKNKIELPKETANVLEGKGYIGKNIILGIRPEGITVKDSVSENKKDRTIKGKVEVAEMLGSEIYLYLNIEGNDGNIIARVESHKKVTVGEQLDIIFDVNKLHIFDKESKTAIL